MCSVVLDCFLTRFACVCGMLFDVDSIPGLHSCRDARSRQNDGFEFDALVSGSSRMLIKCRSIIRCTRVGTPKIPTACQAEARCIVVTPDLDNLPVSNSVRACQILADTEIYKSICCQILVVTKQSKTIKNNQKQSRTIKNNKK